MQPDNLQLSRFQIVSGAVVKLQASARAFASSLCKMPIVSAFEELAFVAQLLALVFISFALGPHHLSVWIRAGSSTPRAPRPAMFGCRRVLEDVLVQYLQQTLINESLNTKLAAVDLSVVGCVVRCCFPSPHVLFKSSRHGQQYPWSP